MMKKAKSRIHGKGIFSTKRIPKNAVFYEVDLGHRSDKPHRRWAYIGKGRYVSDPILNYVNHSCLPTVALRWKGKRLVLVSLHVINIGKEITCDYNKTEKGGAPTTCTCGSPNCRGFFLRRE